MKKPTDSIAQFASPLSIPEPAEQLEKHLESLGDDKRQDAALWYAAEGWPVFPCYSTEGPRCTCGKAGCSSPGKHPLTAHGVKEATTDPETIENWWAQWPNANVAIATGSQSFLVLDVDGEEGERTLTALEEQLGPLPETVMARTGGGGRHILFQPVPGVKNLVRVAPGLDIRSDGGYIIAPPSTHVSGETYVWDLFSSPQAVPLAPLPPAWIDRITGYREISEADVQWTNPADALKGVPEGERDNSIFRYACSLRARGTPRAEAEILVKAAAANCAPPFPEAEALRKLEQAWKYKEGHSAELDEDGEEKRTQSQVLLDIAQQHALFHSPEGGAYSRIEINGHSEVWPVRSSGYRNFLRHEFYAKQSKPPSAQAFSDALGMLESICAIDKAEAAVYTRTAMVDGEIWVDLANAEWESVRITKSGWEIVKNSSVYFVRPSGMLPLPRPVKPGDISKLRPFLNLESEADWRLTVAWVLKCFVPDGSYPVLGLSGVQGSAKSTETKMLKLLTDPSSVLLRGMPKNPSDLVVAAKHNHVLSLDNVSGIEAWLSDLLCSVSTGGGFGTRRLYSDMEEVQETFKLPIILNGINNVIHRHDLADRTIAKTLPPIPEEKRKLEADLMNEFDKVAPEVLGGIFTAIAVALKNRHAIKPTRLPRMADFAVWIMAAEEALPWPAGGFMEAYDQNRAAIVETAVEGDMVAAAVKKFAEDLPTGEWTGTASELLSLLEQEVGERTSKNKFWPQNATSFSMQLNRASGFLEQIGIKITNGRSHGKRIMHIQRTG